MSDAICRKATKKHILSGVLCFLVPLSALAAADGSVQAITAGGAEAITAGGGRAITAGGAELLLVGVIEDSADDFIVVLGQSIFGSRGDWISLTLGNTVAVYGTIDVTTGSIVNASVVPAAASGVSYLRGIVDSVDAGVGRAVVSGVNVDYNALLSRGVAPSVGDEVAISGRSYGGLGLLVAQP